VPGKNVPCWKLASRGKSQRLVFAASTMSTMVAAAVRTYRGAEGRVPEYALGDLRDEPLATGRVWITP